MGWYVKTGFKNVLEEKEKKTVKNPWNFDQPPYDQRTSCYVNAGTHYGTGKNQPVGTTNQTSKYAIPLGRVNTLETFYKHPNISSNVDVKED